MCVYEKVENFRIASKNLIKPLLASFSFQALESFSPKFSKAGLNLCSPVVRVACKSFLQCLQTVPPRATEPRILPDCSGL